MEPEPRKQPLRFYEIDFLRFLAALSVVLYHYTFVGFNMMNLSPVRYPVLEPYTKYGYLGVELFFVISGYVVLMSAYNKTLKQFFLSRVTRLYPAFWAACTLTYLCTRLLGPPVNSPAWSSLMDVPLREYALNLTMLQEFFGGNNLDGPYWSLTVELKFYFLIALMLSFGWFKRLDIILAGWLLYTGVVGPTPAIASPFFYLLFPNYSAFFVAGMTFFMLQNRLLAAWKLYGLLLVAFLLSLRSARTEAITYAGVFHQPFSLLVIGLVIAVIFGVFWLISKRQLNLQRAAWLAYAGAVTYPLYLLHSNIGFVLFQRLGASVNSYVLLAGIVGLMLLSAYLLHITVEKRFSKPFGQQVNRLLTYLS